MAFAIVGCASSPVPSGTTATTPRITTAHPGTAQPAATASPVPSPTPLAREIDATKFTQRGGCGDTFLWAATQDGATAISVEWQGAASEAWTNDGFNETAELPDADIRVTLATGRLLSTIYCNDVLTPEAGADTEVPAVAGQVSIVVRPDPGGFQPASHADLTLTDIAFEVVFGTEPEVWRLDDLEWQDELVGWFAG